MPTLAPLPAFRAVWDHNLRFSSTLVTLLCLGLPVLVYATTPGLSRWAAAITIGLPLLIVVQAAFFMVQGYSLEPGALLIHRLYHITRVPIANLTSAEARPDAFRRGWRVFGSSGLFAHLGYFRSPSLGLFRAWATAPAQAVVLRTPDRTLVITPADPAAFLDALRPHLNPDLAAQTQI